MKKLLIPALITLLIITSGLAIRFYYISQGSPKDKNFSYNWSFDNQRLGMTYKPSQKLYTHFYDENYDFNFEKIFTYTTNGRSLGKGIDENENGIWEFFVFYDELGKENSWSYDDNEDGRIDRMKYLLEDGKTLYLTDENRNGIYEIKSQE